MTSAGGPCAIDGGHIENALGRCTEETMDADGVVYVYTMAQVGHLLVPWCCTLKRSELGVASGGAGW